MQKIIIALFISNELAQDTARHPTRLTSERRAAKEWPRWSPGGGRPAEEAGERRAAPGQARSFLAPSPACHAAGGRRPAELATSPAAKGAVSPPGPGDGAVRLSAHAFQHPVQSLAPHCRG